MDQQRPGQPLQGQGLEGNRLLLEDRDEEGGGLRGLALPSRHQAEPPGPGPPLQLPGQALEEPAVGPAAGREAQGGPLGEEGHRQGVPQEVCPHLMVIHPDRQPEPLEEGSHLIGYGRGAAVAGLAHDPEHLPAAAGAGVAFGPLPVVFATLLCHGPILPRISHIKC